MVTLWDEFKTARGVYEAINLSLFFKFTLTVYALQYNVEWLDTIYNAFHVDHNTQMFALILAFLAIIIFYGINQNAFSTKAAATVMAILLAAWLYTMNAKPIIGLIMGGVYVALTVWLYYFRRELR